MPTAPPIGAAEPWHASCYSNSKANLENLLGMILANANGVPNEWYELCYSKACANSDVTVSSNNCANKVVSILHRQVLCQVDCEGWHTVCISKNRANILGLSPSNNHANSQCLRISQCLIYNTPLFLSNYIGLPISI